jgi:hypothetical protein
LSIFSEAVFLQNLGASFEGVLVILFRFLRNTLDEGNGMSRFVTVGYYALVDFLQTIHSLTGKMKL